MKNTYYPQAYKCDLGHITKHYVWSNELNVSQTCTCGQLLTVRHIHTEKKQQLTSIRTPTKNR